MPTGAVIAYAAVGAVSVDLLGAGELVHEGAEHFELIPQPRGSGCSRMLRLALAEFDSEGAEVGGVVDGVRADAGEFDNLQRAVGGRG